MSQIEKEKLVETRQRLLEEFALLSFQELNKRPDENAWSIAQICHHLSLTETSFTKAVRYGLKQTEPRITEPKSMDSISDRTRKYAAPDIVKPGEEPLDAQQIINLLTESRSFLFNTLDKIEDTAILAERTAKHPLFGELPLYQWVELVGRHEQRHIEQIKEAKAIK
jgi:hypothetical protein